MEAKEILKRVYEATNSGLTIITDLLTGIDDTVINNGKAFRLRTEERTPSAHLYPPKDGCGYYRVVDYGGTDGERSFSPIDLYMREKGYASKTQFSLALHELMERYGVTEELNPKVNKPEITQRDAREDEMGKPPRLTLREDFTNSELSAWGPRVKFEHLRELGWSAVAMVETTKDGKTTVKKSTETYPIFAQTCEYTDGNGNLQQFQKVYEPKCFNKAYRFFTVGKTPRNYIYGLSALRRKFEEHNEKKLDVAVIVSGGSDAVNCLSMGWQPVWFNSETADISAEDLNLLHRYAKRVVLIPDADTTGIKTTRQLALRFPTLYVAWLKPEDMGGLHDNRGRQRKDLKDYILLHPSHEDMKRLIDRAKCSLYWTKTDDKDNNTQYTILPARLNYYLSLNGFYTLKDDTRKEPLYIHVDGVKVRRVVAKTITNFLIKQAEREGLDEALLNKLMKCRDLPTDHVSHLEERSDLDFTKCTAQSQKFFFRNGWVQVTADGIKLNRYSEACGCHVWEDAIIPHDYRNMKPMFRAVKQDDGTYAVEINEDAPSKFFHFIVNASRLYWRKEDEEGMELTDAEHAEEHQCLVSKLACIGYLLFGYKSESEAWAPFCQDTKLAESEDECNGGSGKSMFLKAIAKLLNFVLIEARVPSIIENRFIFDGVSEDTDLIIVDECDRRLNYDFFFGRITGDFTGEEKGNHPFLIPFSKSPKLAFATNYVLKRHDASIERRLWPQVFADYYHEATKKNDYRESRSIRDDLGCDLMGTEYSEQDWLADIAFMLQCLQFYLSLPKGERRIIPPLNRIERREQMAVVGKDFKEWADEYFAEDRRNLNCKLNQNIVLAAYNQEATYQLKMGQFTHKLKEYCNMAEHIHCLNPIGITGKKKDGDRWVDRDENGKQVQYYYIQSTKAATEAANQEPVQQELPL